MTVKKKTPEKKLPIWTKCNWQKRSQNSLNIGQCLYQR